MYIRVQKVFATKVNSYSFLDIRVRGLFSVASPTSVSSKRREDEALAVCPANSPFGFSLYLCGSVVKHLASQLPTSRVRGPRRAPAAS